MTQLLGYMNMGMQHSNGRKIFSIWIGQTKKIDNLQIWLCAEVFEWVHAFLKYGSKPAQAFLHLGLASNYTAQTYKV